MKRWKKKLGVVGVDSASLIVMDPSYIESAWKPSDNAEPVGVRLWGADYEKACTILRERHRSLHVEQCDHGSGVIPVAGQEDADVVLGIVRQVARMEGLQYLMSAIETDSSQHECFRTRTNDDHGGQLHFADGGAPGLGVVFQSGFGDGVYEVIAHYVSYPKWGPRIERVEIVLIDAAREEVMTQLVGPSGDDDDADADELPDPEAFSDLEN
jgi:hypothetical protein